MRYLLEDALDHVVARYTPKQYAYATLSLLAVALCASAVFAIPGLWLAAVSLALALPVIVATICVFGVLLNLTHAIGHNEQSTRLLAVLSASAAALTNWLFLVPFLYFGAWGPVWLQALCALAAFAWTLSLVSFAARRRNQLFTLFGWY